MIDCAFYGHVGRDAELKTSKAGKAYVRLSVRDGDGDAAQWVTVMYFGADAAELAPKFTKGARCYVEGQIRLDTWEQQDGTKRSGLTVMSFHCRIPEIGRNKPPRERQAGEDKPAPVRGFHDDNIGF
jgi:single-stranded DNA-binding protein